ncbi:MAG: hypothetical protein K6A39_01255 [Clostridiales bacterium]|nr:hypothetical protein [Clostridiales bacterium]
MERGNFIQKWLVDDSCQLFPVKQIKPENRTENQETESKFNKIESEGVRFPDTPLYEFSGVLFQDNRLFADKIVQLIRLFRQILLYFRTNAAGQIAGMFF